MKIHSGRWDHPGVRGNDNLTRGERIADATVKAMGSWAFVVTLTAVITAWVAINIAVIKLEWDPYPFILLNLAFSTQAAYAAPLVLISQRRNEQQAGERAEHDLAIRLETLDLVKRIDSKLGSEAHAQHSHGDHRQDSREDFREE